MQPSRAADYAKVMDYDAKSRRNVASCLDALGWGRRTKTDILMAALLADAAEHLTPADHGDLGDDLRDNRGRLADFLTRSDPGADLLQARPARCGEAEI